MRFLKCQEYAFINVVKRNLKENSAVHLQISMYLLIRKLPSPLFSEAGEVPLLCPFGCSSHELGGKVYLTQEYSRVNFFVLI